VSTTVFDPLNQSTTITFGAWSVDLLPGDWVEDKRGRATHRAADKRVSIVYDPETQSLSVKAKKQDLALFTSPVIAGDAVYAGGKAGVGSFHAESGEVIWYNSLEDSDNWSCYASPLSFDGLLVMLVLDRAGNMLSNKVHQVPLLLVITCFVLITLNRQHSNNLLVDAQWCAQPARRRWATETLGKTTFIFTEKCGLAGTQHVHNRAGIII